ncbi:PAQR family membrane homeostasis protein TrhA [Stenotrophobium rhamnosiphilum]|uniref:Hemolysin III n=1 Tax=Stenotrophobium rhamnosiphilum TaxID=2029166 RepID=A0A2T5MFD1_9GAMM|nr:hemolysin III family protein [Stenotrophobium rhamnosiphilum]PTU31288.1 hemolysin III [Stenotrophobium rhamnosiphilum]
MSQSQSHLVEDISAGLAEVRTKLYSVGEEVAHVVTHGLGAVLSIAGLTILVARAAMYGDVVHVTASAIFGASLVMMYAASALFHGIQYPRAKHILRVIDHSLIYVLIAGTYTPFTLITLSQSPWGWILFGVTWGLALFGIVFKVFATGKFEKLSLAIYLGMGWCVLFAIKPLLASMPTGGLWLLLAGGLTYSGGVAFYVMERLRYHHAIWHVFVLGGSVFHYFAILLYVIPGAPAVAA